MNLHKVYYVMFVIVTVCNGFTVAEEKLAVTGSNVQLICPIKGNSNSSPAKWISWYKIIDSTDVLYADATILASSLDADLRSRLKITGDQTAGEYHLNISDVRTSDGGKYKCLLTGSFAPVFTNLTVITGPTSVMIENMTSDNKIHITEGQDMTIKCKALGGTPVPDILLQVLGTTSTGEQSAEHTFRPNSSIDGVAVTCQAGYKQINFYPLKTTAYIYLTSKPVVTPFASDILSTEETTKSLDVICISTGSRPAAAIYWFLGQKRTNITANSTSISKQESPTNKFTVTSTLKYSVNRKFNGQNLTCGAMNIAGTMERSLFLNIKYAPSVTVENITFSQSQSSRQIHSSLESNPLVNICTWNHRSKYGENIRAWNNNNQTLTLPTLPEDQRYQDTGEYICTADNGIVGMNGQLKQTGSGYIRSINALPVITADNNFTQYGKFGKSTELKVNVYSIPKYSMISWYIGSTHLVSNKYVIKEEPVIVKDVFHGVKVQLDGYRVTLTISDLQIIDFTNYTLRLYNGTQYVQHDVTLESASAPETPSNFTITDSGETSITVQWIPGYDGGQTQTFFIEYRITGSILWTSLEIKSSNKLDTHNLYTLSGLQDQTLYDLRMFAKNIFNQSQHTDIEKIKTTQKAKSTDLGRVIGGVAGGLLIAIIVLIAFIIFKRKTGSGFPSKRTRSHSDSEVEEGLKDNVLYEGSEPEGLKVNILYQSAGPDTTEKGPSAEYAEVSKPHKKPNKSSNDEYAEVQKQNDEYAEVDRKAQQKNVKKKKQKDKKKPPKSEKTKSGALNNNPDGEYANSGIPIGNIGEGAENWSAGNKKNDQGLEYADLTFGNKIPKGKQPVIHGDENRTIYSDVDHTKKAPPPPQESEYEETTIRHGKK